MRVCLLGFVAAFAVGSLVEYWGHRCMHVWLKRKTHVEHHAGAATLGLWREFRGYACAAWPMFLVGFVHSMPAGTGFAAGAIAYGAFAAYAHELQHQHPECCFWLKMPVHHVHHLDKMWHHNFGITFPLWDRVFGTYRRSDWQPTVAPAWRNLFRVRWGAAERPR
jgi:sterol desaturase/sphingolipid hydroxylase (fatty acid hydroxylase superfamily)